MNFEILLKIPKNYIDVIVSICKESNVKDGWLSKAILNFIRYIRDKKLPYYISHISILLTPYVNGQIYDM